MIPIYCYEIRIIRLNSKEILLYTVEKKKKLLIRTIAF